jgi:hypothetical protein
MAGIARRAPLIRIEAPHFVAGIIPRERAAPILAWMLNWSLEAILVYCRRKEWRFQIIT